MIAGRGARFNSDALKHRVCQLKQRKIGMRQKLCFDGLNIAMLHKGLSNMVKTVKDHVAIKTNLNGPLTTLRLRPVLQPTFYHLRA
jgi:hypothetical protein